MSSLANRLREIIDPGGGRVQPSGGERAPIEEIDPCGDRRQPARNPDAVAETLGGWWDESQGQRYLVIDRAYKPGYRHGSVAMMDCLPPWPRLSLLRGSGESHDPLDRLLFIDLETTGLTGGAGTYAFLIGCGWFDPPSPSASARQAGGVFRIRQLFLSAYSGERALLGALTQLADGITGVVSFNGKSFDVPLIETRYLFHRLQTPFAGVPHVDMLHPARRLWRAEGEDANAVTGSCKLAVLEQALCGVTREGDVAGFEIPARYFNYVRTGDARPLERVFEHNRLDLLSLALLTAEAARLLDEGPSAARSAREALGMGRLYERGGLSDEAREAYAIAAGIGHREAGLEDRLTRAEALRCYAVICRRQRRYMEAAEAWQRILALRRCPPHITREATEALAVHHEHRVRDLRSAQQFALQSLGFDATASRQHAVQHRLARLERKLRQESCELRLEL